MIARRPGPGELVAGAGGALLLVATFLPWFAVDIALRLPHRSGGTTIRGEGVNAWQAFAVLDVLLLITALAAIALLVLRAADVASARVPVALVTAVAGVVCAALVVFRLLDPPDLPVVEGVGSEVGRRIGAFFALLATAAISWGAFRALAPEAAVAERAPEPEPEPNPNPNPSRRPSPSPSTNRSRPRG